MAAGGAVMTLPGSVLALPPDNAYRNDIGIQLYTLRDAIAKDATATLAKVANAGYRQVEPYGFPDCDPILEAADAAGLPVRSSHFAADPLIRSDGDALDQFARIVEKANDRGLKHLVIPYIGGEHRKSLDDYRRMAESFNAAAEIAHKAGIQLAYHNHAFEFIAMNDSDATTSSESEKTGNEPAQTINTVRPRHGYDVFAKAFSPKMQFEVDVFWVQVAGVDPVKLIGDLSGRVSQLHLKDLSADVPVPTYEGVPKEGFEELGDGVVNIEAIIEAAAPAGVAHCHVEQDHSPHPIKSIRQSLKYLSAL